MYSVERKLTLLLLCWFFGIISAHRFYTGKYFTATLQITLLATVGALLYFDIRLPSAVMMPMIFAGPCWVLIDLMRIIIGHFTDREGQRVTEWA